MKILFFTLPLLTFLIPSSISNTILQSTGKVRFSEIKTFADKWNELYHSNVKLFEATRLGSGSVQVSVDDLEYIKTMRWSIGFDIGTNRKFKNSTAGKISYKILNQESLMWLQKELSTIDSYPVKDYFITKDNFAQKITLMYTNKSRHLEIMIKLN